MLIRPLLSAFTIASLALVGCSHPAPAEQQAAVRQAFDNFKVQITLNHISPALACVDDATLQYVKAAAIRPPSPGEPTTDLLIRRVTEKFARGPIGPDLDLNNFLERVLGQGLLRPGDLDPLTLGTVSVDADGQTARADVFWRGTSANLQLVFRLENGRWKIDLLNLLPYAASALAMDRAIKHETEDEQVARLAGAIPIF